MDDLLWTGGEEVNRAMEQICKIYKFGKLDLNDFKYCGRQINKGTDGIRITCPGLSERLRSIHMPEMKSMSSHAKVDKNVQSQLRSVVGSLAWLARVCRPDLSYGVNFLQSAVENATVSDIKYANNLVKVAKETKDAGLFIPVGAFPFEELCIVGIQDASFAADFEVSESGKKLGHRSQSGRMVCLAHQSFKESRKGHLIPFNWHSSTLKRVCRSTLQAETLSLQLGADQVDHVRAVLHGLYADHLPHERGWKITAQDQFKELYLTDCKSLEAYLNHQGNSQVTDKRLAIDLSSLRQIMWRKAGELLGDPLVTDKLPEDSANQLAWMPTEKMIVDCLTKSMKPKTMLDFMNGKEMDCSAPKETAREKERDLLADYRQQRTTYTHSGHDDELAAVG